MQEVNKKMTDYDLGKVVGDAGAKGDKGDTGETGNGIASIVLRSTSGKVKTYRITYTNGNTFDYQVTDGSDASVTIVSSWNSTTSDSKVPSEKLTKDTLDTKADTGHTHTIANVTNLQQSLNSKANTSHTHTVSNITDFPTIPSKTSDLTNDGDGTNAFLTQHQSLSNYVQKSSTTGLLTNDGTVDTTTYLPSSSYVPYYYATCATAAATQDKEVTITDFTLETGVVLVVKFTNANTYNGTARLKINSLTAIDIATVGTTKTTRYHWTAGEAVTFVYDGANFVMINTGIATTSYYGVTKLSSSTSSTSSSLAATPAAVKAAYDLADSKADPSDIPVNTSDLTNDSGFITSAAIADMLTSNDIANNLTTTSSGKVLDARQGKVLADLIGDAITYINQ